ncbi:uncharacterized protein LOC135811432 [Sycon ciliatum]|uniref:uncharacterized protein LOC135811432 n=1 Tax=Sycon ciliatum TaxID=27933 RepID=UPI0031F66714
MRVCILRGTVATCLSPLAVSAPCTMSQSPEILTIDNHIKLTSAPGAGVIEQPRTIVPFPNISFYNSCPFVQIDITADVSEQLCDPKLVLLKEFAGKKYQNASELIPPSTHMMDIATWTGVPLDDYISDNNSGTISYILGITLKSKCLLTCKANWPNVSWVLPLGTSPSVLQTFSFGAALEPHVTMTIRASDACDQAKCDNCQTLYQSCPVLGASDKYYCGTASNYTCPTATMVQSTTTTRTNTSAQPTGSMFSMSLPSNFSQNATDKPQTTVGTNGTEFEGNQSATSEIYNTSAAETTNSSNSSDSASTSQYSESEPGLTNQSQESEQNSTTTASQNTSTGPTPDETATTTSSTVSTTATSQTATPPSTSAMDSAEAPKLAIWQQPVYIGAASGVLFIIACVVVVACCWHCRKNRQTLNLVKRKLPSNLSVAGLGVSRRSGTDINHYETTLCRNSEDGEGFESLSEPNEQSPPELVEPHSTDDTVNAGQTARSPRSRRLKALHNMPRVSEDTATADSSPEHEISAECLKAKPCASAGQHALLLSPHSVSADSNTDYDRQQDIWIAGSTENESYGTAESLNSADTDSEQVQRRVSTVTASTCLSICPSDNPPPPELLSLVEETPEDYIPLTRRTSIAVREKLSEANDYLHPAEVVVRVRTPSTTVPPQGMQSKKSSLSAPCYELVTEFPADTRKTRKPSATPSLTMYDTPEEILQHTKPLDVARVNYEDVMPEPENRKPQPSRFFATKYQASAKSQQSSFNLSSPQYPRAYEMVEITPTMQRTTQSPSSGTLDEVPTAPQSELHVQQSYDDNAPQFIDLGSGIPARVTTSSTVTSDVVVNPIAFLQDGTSLKRDNEYINVSLDGNSPPRGRGSVKRQSSLPGAHEPKPADKSVSKL